ncbi:putative non-structural polyprotein [Solenopsis midden virus]|uniref:RNA-directed RNA polymerase n=1 Tax=Solenopsis midden virus TaxID=2547302 RepID=A0A482CL51_9VIRU|nr:putative non-structural polyprotein [Solenopsis midden virus]
MNDSLRRFRLYGHKKCSGCIMGEGIWEDNIHLLAYLAGDRVGDFIVRKANNLKTRFPGACWHGVQKICKLQTGLMKMGGTRIHPHWRYFTYWDMGYGYLGHTTKEDMYEQSKTWLGRKTHLGKIMEDKNYNYISMLKTEVRRLMDEEWDMPSDVPTVDEWVSSGVWMRGHAGTGKPGIVKLDGKEKKTRKMKGVEGANFSDEEIKEMLTIPVRETFYVMQKSESGKIRPVVKTGNRINRMMDYLSEVWEKGMYGSRISTLFAGRKGNEEVDMELVELTRDTSWYKVPLDQGNFDWKQSKESVLAILDEVWDYIIKKVPNINPEIVAIWKCLRECIFERGAFVKCEGAEKFEWLNGLPSGWRWTALLDTFLNVCSFRVIKRIVEGRINRRFAIRGFHAQGDDVIFAVTNVQEAQYIIDTYRKIGYEVHPMKTYISKTRSEFLRRSYENIGVTGYTARTLLSIRFRNPILELPINKGVRLYSRLTLWHLCYLRGCDANRCSQAYLSDARQMRIETSDAASYALTPSSVGGGGLDPNSSMAPLLREKSDGRWLRMEVDEYYKDVEPRLGKWSGRLLKHGIDLIGGRKYEFFRTLAASWGIRAPDIYGTVKIRFIEVPKITPIQPGSPFDVPELHDIWDLDVVPRLVKNLYQRQLVEQGKEETKIKEPWIGVLRDWRGRMSRAVFNSWILGDIKIPSPITDRVGMKYGFRIKQAAERWLRKALASKDIGLSRLEQYLLWIEGYIRKCYRSYYPDTLLGL